MPAFIFLPKIARVQIKNIKYTSGGTIGNSQGVMITGNGAISGTVKELGLLVSRRVALLERNTFALFGITLSDSNGNYSFKNTNPELQYIAVSLDENGDDTQFNLVGQDLLPGNYDELKANGAL